MADGFGERAAVDPGSLPLASLGAWFSKAAQIVGPVFGFVLLPLYFTNGRLPAPRWRLLIWVTLGLLPVATALTAFSPGEAVYSTGIPTLLPSRLCGRCETPYVPSSSPPKTKG